MKSHALFVKNQKTILSGAFALIMCLAATNVALVSALTYQTAQNVEFTFNPTISVSLSNNDLIIDNLTPNSSSDSNIITVSVSTNTGYGYYMSATAGTSAGDTNLTSTTNSSNVFTNLSANAATLAAFPDDRWGYSYSTDDGSTWISGSQGSTASGYNGLPLDNDDSGATGVILASTDSFSNSGSVKFKIGAKASATQATGTYTNTVNFYAVANPEPTLGPVECEAGKICYNVNSLTPTEGTMGKQSQDDSSNAIADGATVTLLASNFSREGYGFAGWSDTYDYSGNLYGPQETITVPNGTTASGLSLYAIWMPSAGTMQANASSVCSSLTQAPTNGTKTLSSVSALTDQRDNETYAIAKLADGKCWMIENLRLDNTATLTLTNTNNPLNDGTDVTLKHNYTDTDTHNTLSASSNVAYNADTAPDGWCNTNSAACYNQSRLRTDNTANRATNNPNTNSKSMYSYGNYYNWYSATAGRGTYGFSTNNNSTAGDLCPAGWRLPKGGNKTRIESNDDNEFWNLVVDALNGGTNPANYDSSTCPYYTGTTEAGPVAAKLRSYPNNYLNSGYVSGGSFTSRGYYGYYWSSTAGDQSISYGMRLGSYFVHPGAEFTYGENNKYYGRTLRCMASS